MRLFQNELDYLWKENRLRRKVLQPETDDALSATLARLTASRVTQFERAVIEKELIGMALTAENAGTPLSEVLGSDKEFLKAVVTGRRSPLAQNLLLAFEAYGMMWSVYSILPFLVRLLDHLVAPATHPLPPFWVEGALGYGAGILPTLLATLLIATAVDFLQLHPWVQAALITVLMGVWIAMSVLVFDVQLPNQLDTACVATVLLSCAIWLLSRLAWNAYVHKQSERFAWRD